MRRRWSMTLLLAMWVAGCNITEFRPPSELVDEPQVLTIRAEPAEAQPGDRVALDALVHWPEGDWEAHWLVCVPEEGDWISTCVENHWPEDGDVPMCPAGQDDSLCRLPAGSSSALDVPAALPLPEGFVFPVFVELVAARASVGWAGCADAVATANPNADCLIALKTLPVSTGQAVNRNPVIADLRVDDAPVDATVVPSVGATDTTLAGVKVRIAVTLDASSVDEVLAEDGTPREAELRVDWYATCGGIEAANEDGDEGRRVECTPPVTDASPVACSTAVAVFRPNVPGDCTVHVVVRDGYGGVAYRSQTITVEGIAKPEDGDDTRGGCGCRHGHDGAGPLWVLLIGALIVWATRRRFR